MNLRFGLDELKTPYNRYVLKHMKKTTFGAGHAPPVRPVTATGQTGEGRPTPNLGFSQCVQRNLMDL
jgi:hypothetical protein